MNGIQFGDFDSAAFGRPLLFHGWLTTWRTPLMEGRPGGLTPAQPEAMTVGWVAIGASMSRHDVCLSSAGGWATRRYGGRGPQENEGTPEATTQDVDTTNVGSRARLARGSQLKSSRQSAVTATGQR